MVLERRGQDTTQVSKAYRDILASDRWQRLANFGARPQRLLFASAGTKDPKASDVLYVNALAVPNTFNTIPEKTLLACGEHGKVTGTLPLDGGETASLFWQIFERQESISTNLLLISNRKVPSPSMNRGRSCSTP